MSKQQLIIHRKASEGYVVTEMKWLITSKCSKLIQKEYKYRWER